MRATEVGVNLVINAGGYNMTGSTATLVVQHQSAAGTTSIPLVVSADGLSASRTTTAADFPVGGPYSIMLKVVNGANTFYSKTATLVVDPILQ